jgi:hypothetical protein
MGTLTFTEQNNDHSGHTLCGGHSVVGAQARTAVCETVRMGSIPIGHTNLQ